MKNKNELKNFIIEIESLVNRNLIEAEYYSLRTRGKDLNTTQYTINLLIKSSKESLKPQKKVNIEGWISLEREIPDNLLHYIEEVSKKGFIDIAERAKIDDETLKNKLSKDRVDSFVNLKIAEGKILAENKKEQDLKKETKSKKNTIIAGSLLLLFTILLLVYLLIIKPIIDDGKMERFYVFATGVNFRTTPTSDGTANKIGLLPLGAELKLIKDIGDWMHAYSVTFEQEGYVNIDYVLSKKDYWELQGIFADDKANTQIMNSYNRRALLKYFQSNNFNGIIPVEIQRDIYNDEQIVSNKSKQIWQFLPSQSEELNLYSSAPIDFTGNKIDEFVCIIRNVSDINKYKLIIYEFDNNRNGTLLYEEEIISNNQLLFRLVKKGTKVERYKFYSNGGKEYPRVSCFIIDNGLKNLYYYGNDYDGESIIKISQDL